MTQRFPAILLMLFLFGTAPVGAADLVREGDARVVSVVDGDTVRLDDGTEVRLVGLQAPKLPLGRPNFKAWPLAEEAKAALAEIVEGKRVGLAYGGARVDRHDRRLAHLHVMTDGAERPWIQGEMLRRGLARVYTFPDNRALAAEMLALETEARAVQRGIWGNGYYRILDPDGAGRNIGSFQLVEGRVLDVATVKGRTYLNFGKDWRTDFTVSISPEAIRTFRAAGIDPARFEGRSIRVRGWISLRNGPMIEVSHPEQIESLDQAGG